VTPSRTQGREPQCRADQRDRGDPAPGDAHADPDSAGTAEQYGGVLVDPLTASQMPMSDVLFGIPLNLFAFSVAWILGMIGWVLTRKGNG
jgi:hypothetical protein